MEDRIDIVALADSLSALGDKERSLAVAAIVGGLRLYANVNIYPTREDLFSILNEGIRIANDVSAASRAI